MKIKFLIISLFCSVSILAQNLVPNPNFEVISSCPVNLDDFPFVNWVVPTDATSDCYNSCNTGNVSVPNNIFGNQFSETGSGYAGFISYLQDDNGGNEYKEYIQAEFINPTVAGACYEISITYSPADKTSYSDGIGVLITNGIPSTYTGQTPQLQKVTVVESKTVWHTLTGEYVATGDETHITIGNFNFDAQTNFEEDESVIFDNYSYFYIDAVSFEFAGESSGEINVDLGDDLAICETDFPVTLSSNIVNGTNIWSTGETGSSIEVFEEGTYFVQTILDCEFGTDTIEVEVSEVVELEVSDEVICFGEDITITLDASLGIYNWSGGVTGNTFVVTQEGDYFVELSTDCGLVYEEFTVDEIFPIVLDEQNDISLCETEFPILIDYSEYSNDNNEFLWQDGSSDPFYTIFEEGNYTLSVFNDCFSDNISFNVFVSEEFPNTFEFTDTILCNNEPKLIDIDFDNVQYLWQDGATSSFYFVQEAGLYSVVVFNACGSETYEFNIIEPELLESFEFVDSIICQGEPKLIDIGIEGVNYEWQDGSTESFFLAQEAGIYSVVASNDCNEQLYEFEIVDQELLEFFDFNDTIACENESKLIDIGIEDVDYLWQDGSTESFFIAQGPGIYSVEISNFCGLEIFEIEIVEAEELTLNLGDDVELCPGDSVFVSSQEDIEINWSTGESGEGIWVKEEGELIGLIAGNCDVVRDTINISFNGEIPQISLPDSLLLCEGDTLNISAIDDPSGISFEWNTGNQSSDISITSGGNFIVTGSNNCGVTVDSVFISVGESLQDPNLNDIYQICPGDSLNVSISSGEGIIEWSTGSQDSFITVFEQGMYAVQIENSCKTKTDSFELSFFPEIMPFDLGVDAGICIGDSVIITAPVLDGMYTWNTLESTNEIEVNQPGIYSLEIEGICNTVVDTIEIIDLGSSPDLDLGSDVSFCTGDSITLTIDVQGNTTVLWNTGSEETSIIIDVPETYIVSGTNACGTSFDTIVATINDAVPEINLGEDQEVCSGDSIILDLGIVSGDIMWSTGSEETSIVVNEAGIYVANLSSSCGESVDSIEVQFLTPPHDLEFEDSISICFYDIYEISIDVPNDVSILWSTGSTDTVETFFFGGDYSVELSNECGVVAEDFTIETIPILDPFALPNDITICDIESYTINSGISQSDITVEWNTGEESSTIEVDEGGVYWVETSNECYTLRDSMNIEFNSSPEFFNLGPDDTICSGVEIFLDGTQSSDVEYQWQDGNISSTYTVTNSGLYILEATNFCGSISDSVEIVVLDIEEIESPLEDIYTNCEGSSLLIDLSEVIADEIIWNDGSTERIRELITPSFYSIEFINSCFETIVDFTFQQENCEDANIYIPNVFTPNLDGNNDEFLIFLPDEWDIQFFELGIYNRWGERVYLGNNPNEGWDGNWKGKSLNPGVYAYIVKVQIENEAGSREVLLTGDVTILK